VKKIFMSRPEIHSAIENILRTSWVWTRCWRSLDFAIEIELKKQIVKITIKFINTAHFNCAIIEYHKSPPICLEVICKPCAALFRIVNAFITCERIDTADNDFLDIDGCETTRKNSAAHP
jgi:hypothetical protein